MATAPITVIVDGLPVTYCPTGYAQGCFEIQSRGRGMDYANVTVWPSAHQHRLTSGAPDKYLDLNMKGLWQQEAYVFLLEFGMTVEKVLQSLNQPEEFDDKACRMCEKPTIRRVGTNSPRLYCSKSCQMKYAAWAQLAKELTEKFQDNLHSDLNEKLKARTA